MNEAGAVKWSSMDRPSFSALATILLVTTIYNVVILRGAPRIPVLPLLFLLVFLATLYVFPKGRTARESSGWKARVGFLASFMTLVAVCFVAGLVASDQSHEILTWTFLVATIGYSAPAVAYLALQALFDQLGSKDR